MTATDAFSAGQDTQAIAPRPEAAEIPALSIDGVSHSYGARQALIDIGFTVAPAVLLAGGLLLMRGYNLSASALASVTAEKDGQEFSVVV